MAQATPQQPSPTSQTGDNSSNEQKKEQQRQLIRQFLQKRGAVNTPITKSELSSLNLFVNYAQNHQPGGSITGSQPNNVLSGANSASSSPVPQVKPQGASSKAPFQFN